MQLTESVVEGTLKPDGTLELDQKPTLAPGRVTVILRQESHATAGSGWWQAMQKARQAMIESGSPLLDEAELQARIDELREEDRTDEMLRELDKREQKPE